LTGQLPAFQLTSDNTEAASNCEHQASLNDIGLHSWWQTDCESSQLHSKAV